MLKNQFAEGVAAARSTAALDNVARLLWRAHADGHIADADADAVAGAIQGRRAVFALPPFGVALSQIAAASAPRRPARPRSPDKHASLERRRRCAMSGAIPAHVASAFTTAEVAVLSVIAAQVRKAGVCILPLDALAALAGVCRTSAQNAVRAAERLGLILRTQRRRRGLPSLSNVLRIVSAEWLAWLQHGKQEAGFKSLSTTNNNYLSKGSTRKKVDPKGVIYWRVRLQCGTKADEKANREGTRTLKKASTCSLTLKPDTLGLKNLPHDLP